MKRVHQKLKGGERCHWACFLHIEDKEACGMKREQEESIRNAFRTMMNKLVFAEKRVLDVYIEDLRSEEAKGKEAEIALLNEKLKTVTDEKHRLSLLLSRGCGEPVFFRQKMMELEQTESFLNGELMTLQGDSPAIRRTKSLKDALSAWKRDNSDPDAFFTEVCDSAVVMTGGYVEFNLKCGLKLREGLEAQKKITK